MTSLLALVPIGTVLTILTNEILETALAAQDVLMEKESFTLLSKHILSIHPVLNELLLRQDMADTPVVRQALAALGEDVGKAKHLIDMCGKRSRFYQLVHCRSIVKQAEEITQDLGKSLALLSLASAEVSMDIHNNVDKLKDQMMHAEYRASNQQLEIVNKIEMGIRQHKTDQTFLNDLIHEIARAVGVPVEDSTEMSKELEYFTKEKEEAAERKEREEEVFMEQIIALLSRAEAARTPEGIREEYKGKRYLVNVDIEQEPFESFRCPLSREVMQDPVSIASGLTLERANIEEWFANGNKTDPITGKDLADLSLKPNHKIRESIEEWIDRNYCIRIQNARRKLESGEEAKVKEALEDLRKICNANYKIRHWIAEEKLVKLVVEVLRLNNEDNLKNECLSTLQIIVSDNEENKRQLVDAGGVEHVVRYLAVNMCIAKVATALLAELLKPDLQGVSSQSSLVLEKIGQENSAILLLVKICKGVDVEAAQNAGKILKQLAHRDENVVEMAKVNWPIPLLERLQSGSEQSKLLMAKSLGDLELARESMESLGEGGAIALLVEMMTGNLENKAASLCALQNLVSYKTNRQRLAQTGAVPIILEHLYSICFPSSIRESAAAILQRLVSKDGNSFLKDENGDKLDLQKILQDLLMAIQDSFSSNSPVIHKQIILTILGLIYPPDVHETRKILKDADGVAILLPFLEHRDAEIRNAVVQILCTMSRESMNEICHFIMNRKKLIILFTKLLHEGVREEVQASAAGILSCLPAGETNLTLELMERNAVPMLLHHIVNGGARLKENAMGALLRFTSPSDVQIQKKVVDLGIFPALRSLIKSGTTTAKIGAVIALRNLSESTMQLSIPAKSSGCFFCTLKRPPTGCPVHGGECGEKTTFCLVEAGVISDIVSLLTDSHGDGVAEAIVETLSTLLPEKENLEKAVMLLHEQRAIRPILGLLSHGTDVSKERAIAMLTKIFKVKVMRELYGSQAQMHLANVAMHGSESLGKQAAEVLAVMQPRGSSILF